MQRPAWKWSLSKASSFWLEMWSFFRFFYVGRTTQRPLGAPADVVKVWGLHRKASTANMRLAGGGVLTLISGHRLIAAGFLHISTNPGILIKFKARCPTGCADGAGCAVVIQLFSLFVGYGFFFFFRGTLVPFQWLCIITSKLSRNQFQCLISYTFIFYHQISAFNLDSQSDTFIWGNFS